MQEHSQAEEHSKQGQDQGRKDEGSCRSTHILKNTASRAKIRTGRMRNHAGALTN